MTNPKQRRDHAYYLDRMKAERPDVFDDYQKRKFKNASAAIIAAGLRKPTSRLKVLTAAWQKASQAERDAFKALIGCSAAVPSISSPTAQAQASRPVRAPANRTLTPAEATAIRDIIARRKMKPGQVMREMGFKALDASLGMALSRGTQLQPDLLEALERWLIANGAST
ncbi:hypothetical protein [Paracoccus sp. KR1-242]|uniref:hypothetical protein n=1 Tax=Paracoccus sp. KR1-242 TaxID=3410028 RepID=UPI003C04A100